MVPSSWVHAEIGHHDGAATSDSTFRCPIAYAEELMLSDELQTDGQRLLKASAEWVVKVSSLVYDVYGAAATVSAARAALRLGSMAFQPPNNVNITGGYGIFDRLRVQNSPVEPTDVVPLRYARSALFNSGFPLTDKGDLLVCKYPTLEPTVLPVGTNTQILGLDLQWTDPPDALESALPASVTGTDFVVAVGPIEHPSAHDLWFATVGAFNTWAIDRVIVGSLTILPNGFTSASTGQLQLPRCAEGARITIGQPVDAELSVADGVPVSGLTLVGRGTHVVSTVLSLFARFNIEDSVVEADELWITAADSGTEQRVFGPGSRITVGSLNFVSGALFDEAIQFDGCVVDANVLAYRFGTRSTDSVIRFLNSDVLVRTMEEPDLTGPALNLRLLNSSFYVVEEYATTAHRLCIGVHNSHVLLGSGTPA